MIMVLIGVITMFYILFVQGNVLSADPVVVGSPACYSQVSGLSGPRFGDYALTSDL